MAARILPFILQLPPLFHQIPISHSGPLAFGLDEGGVGVFLALGLPLQLGRKLIQSFLLVPQRGTLTLGFVTGVAVGFALPSQNKLIVSCVLVADNGGGFQRVLISLEGIG